MVLCFPAGWRFFFGRRFFSGKGRLSSSPSSSALIGVPWCTFRLVLP
jgi:hypothetical protein